MTGYLPVGHMAGVTIVTEHGQSLPVSSGDVYQVIETLDGEPIGSPEATDTLVVAKPMFIRNANAEGGHLYMSVVKGQESSRISDGAVLVIMSSEPGDNGVLKGIVGRVSPRDVVTWIVARNLRSMEDAIREFLDEREKNRSNKKALDKLKRLWKYLFQWKKTQKK